MPAVRAGLHWYAGHELTSSLPPVRAPYGVPGSRVQVAHTYCTPHARFGCSRLPVLLSSLAITVRPRRQTADHDAAAASPMPAAVKAPGRSDRRLAGRVHRA